MKKPGFTIIELIIVVTVIGILATIATLSYSGYINRANDAAVRADLEEIAGLLESYRVNPNNSTRFPSTKPILDTLGIKATKKAYQNTISVNLVYCLSTTGTDAYQAYKVFAESKSGAIFMMTQDGFKPTTITQSDFSSSLCPTQSLTLVSEGMYQPDNWQTWVGDN